MVVASIESPVKSATKAGKKRKHETNPKESNKKLDSENKPVVKKSKAKKVKSAPPVLTKQDTPKTEAEDVKKPVTKLLKHKVLNPDALERYPVLKNEELVMRFLNVPLTNNQKGRIRQFYRDSLKGTSQSLLPDVINNKIKAIVNGTENLSDTELRKIRILYNMLRTAVNAEVAANDNPQKKNKKKQNKNNTDKKNDSPDENVDEVKEPDVKVKVEKVKKEKVDKDKKEDKEHKDKVKGPKRYVVFVGNLPAEIEKEQLLKHFSEISDQIVDVRIPKRDEGKKSSIAYVELKNEPTYELALSKHHSMLGTKRINVLYTTQKNGKISKSEAKSKSAKLIALQKAGRLLGSAPAASKRSHRRNKMKAAQAQKAGGG